MDLTSLFRGGPRGGGQSPFVFFSPQQEKSEKKKYPIKRAREVLLEQELKQHYTESDMANHAIELAENDGIVFIDEIDKICGGGSSFRGDKKVSQEGYLL